MHRFSPRASFRLSSSVHLLLHLDRDAAARLSNDKRAFDGDEALTGQLEWGGEKSS